MLPALGHRFLGSQVKSALKWSMAAVVTIVAFGICTWLCGALALPLVVKDPGVRWSIAAALGVAVAALAALWGNSFAAEQTPAKSQANDAPRSSSPSTDDGPSGVTRNEISGGAFHGSVIQSRDVQGSMSGGVWPSHDVSERGHVMQDDVRNKISGGMFFSAVFQGREITVVLPEAVRPALEGLPGKSAVFAGRESVLGELMGLLEPASPAAADVSVVSGLAGVGKTELALQAADRALSRGWFHGGVLFVDMFGYDPHRKLDPGRALDRLLRAVGIPGDQIPHDLQDRSRLFSSVLTAYANEGKPVLLVIDNVSSAAQARPLLPRGGKVVVTSRHVMADLDAHLLELESLPPHGGVEVLAGQLCQARGDADTRIAEDRGTASTIARLCGGLPLALRITAALLAANTARSLSSMIADLEDSRTRLDNLRYAGPDSETAVRPAFDLSYRQIEPQQARTFRLFAVNPGPETSAEAVSAMTGLDQRIIRQHLDELARAHLLQTGSRYGMWKMHDLVRLYASELSDQFATTDDRDQARDRLLAYYLSKSEAARLHIQAPPGAAPPDVFADEADALAWLDKEQRSLLAAVTMAAETGNEHAASRLPIALAQYLGWRRRFNDSIASLTVSISASRRLGDRPSEAMALNNIGLGLGKVGRLDEAATAHHEAAVIYHEIGDKLGEAKSIGNLGIVLHRMRRFEEAIAAHQRNLEVSRDLGNRSSEGIALTNLGIVLHELRRFDEAVAAHQEAAAICQEIGNRNAEGQVIDNLGTALSELGRLKEAIEKHRQAIAIFRETADRNTEATAMINLGTDLRRSGRIEDAIDTHRKAAAILSEIGDRDSEGLALDELGRDLRRADRTDEAVDAQRQAVAILTETGNQHDRAVALDGLGLSLRQAGLLDQAATAHRQAIAIFRKTSDRYRVGQARKHLRAARTAG
jgi:tetratricopeptide (TPR) repeat protein